MESFAMKQVIYTSGVFDLLHESHIRSLKRAKLAGGEDSMLIVGVATDEDTEAYKRRPIIPYNQRLKMLNSLGFIDKVITAPLFTNKQFYQFYNIDLHIQGADDAGEIDYYKGGKDNHMIKFIGKDPVESTTSFIQKISNIVGHDFKVEPLSGGISNITWKVSSELNQTSYVLKYLQTSTVESFALRHDCMILGNTFALYRYIDGLVGHISSCDMINFFKTKKENRCTQDLITKKDINLICPSLMRLLSEDDKSLLIKIGILDKSFAPDVKWDWCHNDLVRDNIIKTENEIELIDWEYADYGPSLMDIASCVLNDVVDYEEIPDTLYDKELISILVVFQSLAWIAWYKEYPSEDSQQLIDIYYAKKFFHLNKIKIHKLNYRYA